MADDAKPENIDTVNQTVKENSSTEPDFTQVSSQNELETDAPVKTPDLNVTEGLPEELQLTEEEKQTQSTQPVKSTEQPAVPANVAPITEQPAADLSPGQSTPTPPANPPATNSEMATAFGVGQTSAVSETLPFPDELRGWNWGAFFLSWIWAIGNQVWIGLLALLGPVWLVMMIILGLKGNEWAWKARKFISVETFKKTQSTWAKWGIVLFIIQIILIILAVSAVITSIKSNSTTTTPSYNYNY